MSVLIKGVAMVSLESCAGCDFCSGYILPDGIYTCICPSEISYGRNITENIVKDNKPDWCPIIEVPASHGRLIDADALEPDSDYDDGEYWAVSMTQIEYAPTVIESEERDCMMCEIGNPCLNCTDYDKANDLCKSNGGCAPERKADG